MKRLSDELEKCKRVISSLSLEVDRLTKLPGPNEYLMLEDILANMPGYVYWKNKELKYSGCNNNLIKFSGLKDKSELIGKSDYDFEWGEGQADQFRKDDLEVMKTMKSKITEHSIPSGFPENKEIIIRTEKSPLYINGKVEGVLAIATDVTHQRNIETKLREANGVKTEFIANMSHDLRTPMQGIMGAFIELGHIIREMPKYPNIPADQMIVQTDSGSVSSKALLGLLNEILETVSLESGKVKRTSENFSLSRVLNKNMDLLSSTALQKGLLLTVKIDENTPPNLYGFRQTLDRILVNLISNSIKFTEKGGVTVSASLEPKGSCKTGEKVQIEVCVEDTGIGIPADKFEEIFEHFSKLVSSYRGVYEGYGLGLYAVKQYVDKMEGTIKVESTLNKGSRFIVSLPFIVSDLVDHEEEASLPVENQVKPQATAPTKHSGEIVARILLTEDSAPAALAIISTLKRLGCAIDHAKTGKEAISMAKNNSYDLIFMDIGLPDMLGLDVTKEIRQFSVTPVIALTGHVDKEGVCIEAGMQGLIPKPASPVALEAMLEKYVLSKVAESAIEFDNDDLIIDWNCCVKMLDGSEAIAEEILQMCSEDLSESMKIIDTAYNEHNVPTLTNELHRVRGGVCYLKLPQLERALKDFHLSAREQPQAQEEVEKYYQLLKKAADNFQDALLNGTFSKAIDF